MDLPACRLENTLANMSSAQTGSIMSSTDAGRDIISKMGEPRSGAFEKILGCGFEIVPLELHAALQREWEGRTRRGGEQEEPCYVFSAPSCI